MEELKLYYLELLPSQWLLDTCTLNTLNNIIQNERTTSWSFKQDHYMLRGIISTDQIPQPYSLSMI